MTTPDTAVIERMRLLLAATIEQLTGGDHTTVTVTAAAAGAAIAFEVDVARPHRGRLFGRDGHTIKALRSIFGSIGARNGVAVLIHQGWEDDHHDRRPAL